MGAAVSTDLSMQFPWSSNVQDEEVSLRSSRILCYGDSLTAGYYDGGRRFSPYGKALEGALTSLGFQCEVSINGLSGHRADQMVAELNSPVCQDICGKFGKGLAHILDNDGHFDLVILMAGTNDFGFNSNLKSIQNYICGLHDACHVRGVPTVVLAAPCNTPNMRIGLSQMLRQWANSQNQVLNFFDPEEVIPRHKPSYWEPDRVHFTPSGSRTLGLYLAPAIAQILQGLGQRPEGPTQVPQVQRTPRAGISQGRETARHGYHKATSSQPHTLMVTPRLRGYPAYVGRGGA